MPVEVRQLVIKSTVIRDETSTPDLPEPQVNVEELKAVILTECKQVVLETLREMRER